MQAGVSISGTWGLPSTLLAVQIFPILNFLVQPGSLLGTSSMKTSRSGAGGGTATDSCFSGEYYMVIFSCLKHPVCMPA